MLNKKEEERLFEIWWNKWGDDDHIYDSLKNAAYAAWMYRASYYVEYTKEDL